MSESAHDDMRLCYRIFGFKQEPGSNQIYSASAHDENKEWIYDIPSFDLGPTRSIQQVLTTKLRNELTTSPVLTKVQQIEITDNVRSYFMSMGFMSASAHDDIRT